MPLNKADLGDFSQSDPYYEILRSLQDYGALKRVRTDMHGRRSTNAAKGFENVIPRNQPTRIDLAQLIAAQSQGGQPAGDAVPYPVTPGVPTETVQASEVEPGMSLGMGIPERRGPGVAPPAGDPSPNMPMPEMNPSFHDMGSAPIDGRSAGMNMQRPEMMEMARLLAGAEKRPPFPDPSQWAQFSPGDLRNAPWMT